MIPSVPQPYIEVPGAVIQDTSSVIAQTFVVKAKVTYFNFFLHPSNLQLHMDKVLELYRVSGAIDFYQEKFLFHRHFRNIGDHKVFLPMSDYRRYFACNLDVSFHRKTLNEVTEEETILFRKFRETPQLDIKIIQEEFHKMISKSWFDDEEDRLIDDDI